MRLIKILLAKASDTGATLPFIAFALFLLLGMGAFATDLGWWYLNTIRAQRAADAAALAGVIHMPGFFATADSAAKDLASRNGYTDGVDGTVVTPEPVTGEPHQLRVTIEDVVGTYFLTLFGIDSVTIRKEAVAEYVTALPMGSPENQFGVPSQDYTAAIQAPFTEKEDGDPFATQCELSFDDDSCGALGTTNSEYRSDGYRFGIEVPVGSGVTQFQVQVYDAGWNTDSSLGDARCGSSQPGCNGTSPGATTEYTMFNTDDSPLDHFNNPVYPCPQTNPLTITPAGSVTYLNQWQTLCAVTGAAEGVYPFRVRTVGAQGNAMNMYSVKVCSPTCAGPSGIQPRIYGINDISIWADAAGATPEFFFAEVDDVHAGKTLLLSLFDPGDAEADTSSLMSVLGPDDEVWEGCAVSIDNWTEGTAHSPFTLGGDCTIDTQRTTNDCGIVNEPAGCKYNGDWLTIGIAIPHDYECDRNADPSSGDDCWWKIRYDYEGSVFDRTTWAARVVGNPVHLVFEENAE